MKTFAILAKPVKVADVTVPASTKKHVVNNGNVVLGGETVSFSTIQNIAFLVNRNYQVLEHIDGVPTGNVSNVPLPFLVYSISKTNTVSAQMQDYAIEKEPLLADIIKKAPAYNKIADIVNDDSDYLEWTMTNLIYGLDSMDGNNGNNFDLSSKTASPFLAIQNAELAQMKHSFHAFLVNKYRTQLRALGAEQSAPVLAEDGEFTFKPEVDEHDGEHGPQDPPLEMGAPHTVEGVDGPVAEPGHEGPMVPEEEVLLEVAENHEESREVEVMREMPEPPQEHDETEAGEVETL